jgi:alternate signal-mediated exported protein
MKNSALIKGTAAIAVGAALLLGGGGTLATWNASDNGAPGTIISGDLNVAAAPGVWKDRAGATVDISTYKVVPGDKLTYTQVLNVTLTGNKMAATVAATGTGAVNGFTAGNVVVTGPALAIGGTAVSNPLTSSQTVYRDHHLRVPVHHGRPLRRGQVVQLRQRRVHAEPGHAARPVLGERRRHPSTAVALVKVPITSG